jgi:hypothetical protein
VGDVIPAASENVLMAVDACRVERAIATVGQVTAYTEPKLDVSEVRTILLLLLGDGYLWAQPHDGHATYELTDRGDRHARMVVERQARDGEHEWAQAIREALGEDA